MLEPSLLHQLELALGRVLAVSQPEQLLPLIANLAQQTSPRQHFTPATSLKCLARLLQQLLQEFRVQM